MSTGVRKATCSILTGTDEGYKMREDKENLTPVVIVGLHTKESDEEFDHAMKELKSLCEACDLEVMSTLIQTLPHPDNSTWIGSGKAEELAMHVRGCDASYAVCLGNLLPAQMKNLQKIIDVPVWDRTNLILEIFSRRAHTREARLQVESAYLQYMLPRLTGMWQHLGRQSGGGGSRANKGIGEKQIELDRRQISHRITELRKELANIDRTRDVQRKGRERDGYPNVALVGYTNAGKSSLMNRLLDMGDPDAAKSAEKKVFEKNMLFATLDTSIRKIAICDRKPFLLSDTVGFIENIPHDLIKAFRSTLAEVRYADALLIVMDSSDPHHEMHRKVTEDTLRDLDAMGIPRIYVYNKADLRDRELNIKNEPGSDIIYISARTGYGIDVLLDRLQDIFLADSHMIDILIPYTSGNLLSLLHNGADIISEEHKENGTHVIARCPAAMADRIGSQLQDDQKMYMATGVKGGDDAQTL
ncbi:MAG: GTPase HflX [Lachnospiraceae bacterium]|nr:GTPase HflX [Lachnospiraceae bacterium]